MLTKRASRIERAATSSFNRSSAPGLRVIDPHMIELSPPLHRERKSIPHLTHFRNISGAEVFPPSHQCDPRKLANAALLKPCRVHRVARRISLRILIFTKLTRSSGLHTGGCRFGRGSFRIGRGISCEFAHGITGGFAHGLGLNRMLAASSPAPMPASMGARGRSGISHGGSLHWHFGVKESRIKLLLNSDPVPRPLYFVPRGVIRH